MTVENPKPQIQPIKGNPRLSSYPIIYDDPKISQKIKKIIEDTWHKDDDIDLKKSILGQFIVIY